MSQPKLSDKKRIYGNEQKFLIIYYIGQSALLRHKYNQKKKYKTGYVTIKFASHNSKSYQKLRHRCRIVLRSGLKFQSINVL